MKRRFMAVFTLATLFLVQLSVQACGDKLLAMARTVALYKAYKPWKNASILMYTVHGDSPLKDKQFQSSLTQAGHKVKTLDNGAQFDKTIGAAKYDFVLADISDAPALKQRLTTLHSSASVLPILYKPDKAQLAAAEKQYGIALKAPMQFTEHLQAIDQMMKLLAMHKVS